MNSKLIICQGINIDKSYTNVLSYNLNAMLNLVESKAMYSQYNYNFIDYDKNEIKADVDYAIAIDCNYIAFQNPRHGNKWYFAFIDDVIYRAPKQCTIKFTLDVWSTFHDDWTEKPCFVVREHVNNDAIGANTTDEGVSVGNNYVVNAHLRDSYNRGTQHIIMATNINPLNNAKEYAGAYNGIPSGFKYFCFDNNATGLQSVMDAIINTQVYEGEILQLFMAPAWLSGNQIQIPSSDAPAVQELGVSRITTLDGYTPKNSKMLTYPFCYILNSNGQGQSAILKQELWTVTNGEMKQEMIGALTAGCSIRLVPKNYNGDELNFDEGINLGKFPQLSWSTDAYINWLVENGITVPTQIRTGNAIVDNYIRPTAIGVVNNLTSFASGGLKGLADYLYESMTAEFRPPQVSGNTNAGDVMWSARENCFHTYRMTVKREYAKRIDDYFTRCGYKVNETKLANLTGRQYWNFVEIGKDEIIGTGKVPSKYMEEINNICRQGVTIWHSHENIGNYNLNNAIV